MTIEQLHSLTPGRRFKGLYTGELFEVTRVENSTKKGLTVFFKKISLSEHPLREDSANLRYYEVIEEGSNG